VQRASLRCPPRTRTVKPQRHAVLLALVRERRVSSQEVLRELLSERGIEVAQATLSRDIRELGLVKVPDENGGSVYTLPADVTDPTPTLSRLLPSLYLGADGVGNLLVVKTLVGGAQPIAVGIDWEEWPEVVGTIAGDDTILLILRDPAHRARVTARLEEIAGI
jgi:transcriptional regulator of arginine metabolism